MNKIFWDKDKITIVTNQLEAIEHKHWAMQLFLALEAKLNICVSGKNLTGKCVVVNQNVNHNFSTADRLHISMIIEPTSDLAEQLNNAMSKNEYYICSSEKCRELQQIGVLLLHNSDITTYNDFIQCLYKVIGISASNKLYDDRIKDLLQYIENCTCDKHSIPSYADKVSLSPSRLSHLFREQVGIPLKSYIQFHQMQKAFLALLNGKSITEAAMLANFDTPSHFAAVTKRMMGMPASVSLKNSVFLKVFNG